MFIFKDTKLKANIYAPYTDAQSVTYPTIPMELLEEIPEPQAPEDYSDELYFRTEQQESPYVIYTRKSDEMLAALYLGKEKDAAQQHLDSTDYLFAVDRHTRLLADEPEREAALLLSREAARQKVREWKATQQKEL